jgi:hypothetical protein
LARKKSCDLNKKKIEISVPELVAYWLVILKNLSADEIEYFYFYLTDLKIIKLCVSQNRINSVQEEVNPAERNEFR